ncbi:putative MFS family arabinose efflux permease [Knoellia remsis]|uniref:MFS-type drug efflux transporter P55 n=1 Tax=Knoellia remsis TaxID=407159 RepID=A0A2T0UJZ4_9MICO|nr:MFS transporter [Knoellia remsis]PRY58253.1 putative MFS family arabinose efflux permease [Knoellia remsis]
MRSPAPRALLATASVAVALAAADTYVVVLALTDMMAGVGLGIDSLQRATPIVSGFLLGYIAVLPLIGRLADLVARQRVLLGCLAVFVIGSAITALAVELPVLVAGRVIQGVGGGGLVPATLAIVAQLWSRDRRGTPLGVVGAVQELGSVLGPVLGAAVLAVADWRAIFWLNAVLGVALAAAVVVVGGGMPSRPRALPALLALLAVGAGWLALAAPAVLATSVTWGVPFVPFGGSTSRLATPIGVVAVVLAVAAVGAWLWSGREVLRRADLLGALLLGGALGCIVLTFAASDPEKEVVGPLGFALLPVAVVLAVLYLLHHRRARDPLVPRGVVVGRTRWALLVSLCVGVALVAVIVDVPLLARLVHTESETVAAFVLVRFLVAVPVGALLGGWSLRWLGDGLVSGVGLALAAVGLVAMSTWGRGSLDHWSSTVVLALVGFGIGLALAPVNNAALADSPADAHGTASALVVVARMIGMVVGLALLTAIGLHQYYAAIAALPDQTDGQALLDAAVVQVEWVFRGAAVAALAGALASLALGLRRTSHSR